MADKLFFGEIEAQGRKAVAEMTKKRGTPTGKETDVPAAAKETKIDLKSDSNKA